MPSVVMAQAKGFRKCHSCGAKLLPRTYHLRALSGFETSNHYINICQACLLDWGHDLRRANERKESNYAHQRKNAPQVAGRSLGEPTQT